LNLRDSEPYLIKGGYCIRFASPKPLRGDMGSRKLVAP